MPPTKKITTNAATNVKAPKKPKSVREKTTVTDIIARQHFGDLPLSEDAKVAIDDAVADLLSRILLEAKKLRKQHDSKENNVTPRDLALATQLVLGGELATWTIIDSGIAGVFRKITK